MEAVIFIQNVYKITGIGVIPVGTVKSGTLKVGMKMNINGKEMTIKTIEMHHQQFREAVSGDNVGLSLKNGDYSALKSVVGTEVVLSEGSQIESKITQAPEPIHPVGFFDSLKRMFGKK